MGPFSHESGKNMDKFGIQLQSAMMRNTHKFVVLKANFGGMTTSTMLWRKKCRSKRGRKKWVPF